MVAGLSAVNGLAATQNRHPKSSHCSSTPATDGKHVVAIFGSEGLFCFDMEGKVVWKKDLGPMNSVFYLVPTAQWGFASSPVIYDGKAVALCDVLTTSFIAAFDLDDGKELWRTPRQDVPTWGTPTVVNVGDLPQILVNGWAPYGGLHFCHGAGGLETKRRRRHPSAHPYRGQWLGLLHQRPRESSPDACHSP
jgi:outer membrane protein assembly factor BamB